MTTHGIQHICHFSSNSPVRHVTYNQATGDFVSLSSDGTLRVYQCEGRLRASFPSAEPFSGIASTVLPDRYAAWGPGNRLAVLDREFRTISSTCSSRDIHTCLSKEGVYELVVGGAGHVSVWCLRHLVCRVEITEGLGTRDVFTELVLPKAASPKSQRCFAMSSAGVALFHLSKGMLLAYKKDLHLWYFYCFYRAVKPFLVTRATIREFLETEIKKSHTQPKRGVLSSSTGNGMTSWCTG